MVGRDASGVTTYKGDADMNAALNTVSSIILGGADVAAIRRSWLIILNICRALHLPPVASTIVEERDMLLILKRPLRGQPTLDRRSRNSFLQLLW